MPYEPCRSCSRTRNRGVTEVNGQYRVTVPDPDALDRLRTRNRVYDRTLQPRERFAGGNPTGTHSLPASSRESSTEPMDTDEGARTTREIAEKHSEGAGKRTCRVGGTRTKGPDPPICGRPREQESLTEGSGRGVPQGEK